MATTTNLGFYYPNKDTDGANPFNTDTMLRDNWVTIDGLFDGSTGHGHTGVDGDGPQITAAGLAAGAATDTVIGTRTVNDAAALGTTDTDSLGNLLSRFSAVLKAFSGGTNWFDAPTITLSAVNAHVAQTAAGVHGSTSAATAGTLMHRDASGRAKVATPSASDDIARKDTVDAVQTNLNAHAGTTAAGTHGSTSSPTASTLMHRDASGRAQVAAPSAAADIARKDTVDAVQTNLNTHTGNSTVHITSAERTSWNGAVTALGSYTLDQDVRTTASPTFKGLTIAGTSGNMSASSNGVALEFDRAAANYFRATATGGYFVFNVNGNAIGESSAPFKISASKAVTTLNNTLDDGSGNATFKGLTVAGTSGNVAFGSTGNVLTFTRGSANYIGATTAGGYISFSTNGDAVGGTTPTLKLDSDYSVKTKYNTLDDGSGNATFKGLTVTGTGTTFAGSVSAKSAMYINGTATDATNSAILQIRDSAGTRLGYFGDGSGSTNDMIVYSDAGGIKLLTASGSSAVTTNKNTLDDGNGNASFVQLSTTSGGLGAKFLPGTQDHSYIGFFPRSATPAVRGAYVGFGSAGGNEFSIVNEITNGSIRLTTAGVGSVNTDNNTLDDGNGNMSIAGSSAVPISISRNATVNAGISYITTGGTVCAGQGDAGVFGINDNANLSLSKFKVTAATGEATINGNTVWHAGNDGSGSTMDADLLDGKHASDFISQPPQVQPYEDLNAYQTPGMYYCSASATAATLSNSPTSNAFSLLVERGSGFKQTLSEYMTNGSKTWIRNQYSGTWGSWRRTWDSSTDGSGSGMDADKLDGLEASDFARKSASVSESTITATTAQNVINYTATDAGNYDVKVYLRVTASVTVSYVSVYYTDMSGTQQETKIAQSLAMTTANGVSLLPVFINVKAGTAVIVQAQASAANVLKVSASVVEV